MKRVISILLLVCFIFSFTLPHGSVKGASYTISISFTFTPNSNVVVVDGFNRTFSPKPILKGNLLYVPIRYVIEAAGGDVGWNGKTKIVSLKINDTNVSLSPVSSRITINGSANQANNTPILEKGTTFVAIKDIVSMFSGNSTGDYSFSIPKQLIKVFDETGRQVYVPKKINRIASLYPMTTTLLFPFKIQDKLVGAAKGKVVDYSKVFPRISEIPDASSYTSPNVETIVSLKPDVIIAPYTTPLSQLQSVNLPVLLFNMETTQGLLKSIQFLGTILGKAQEATDILVYLNSKLNYIKTQTGFLQNKKSVYFALSSITKTAGSTLIQNEMIVRASGVSVTAQLPGGKVDVSLEQVIKWNPEYIILAPYCSDTVDSVLQNPALQSVKAVKNKNVYKMPQFIGSYDLPEPEVILGIMWLSNTLYPDKVHFDLRNEAKTFYKKVFDYTLTDADLERIFGK